MGGGDVEDGREERERKKKYVLFSFQIGERWRAGTRRSVAGRCQPSYSNSLTDTRIRAGCRCTGPGKHSGILTGQLIKDRMQVCQVFLFCFGFCLFSFPKCM